MANSQKTTKRNPYAQNSLNSVENGKESLMVNDKLFGRGYFGAGILRTASYRGRYHVLGGTLSAIDGIGPEELNIVSLIARARAEAVKEVILATNATVDGQTTGHYVVERLAGCGVDFSRLAHGVPMGGELDYLDDGTLTAALKARRPT